MHRYPDQDIAAIYRVIEQRRDMRHFLPDPVDPALLRRLLEAAHHAPSVGYMQPWRFIRIVDRDLRENIGKLVDAERLRTAEQLGERQAEFLRLKVEGIRDCGEVLVAALMDGRERHVFGRRTLPEMDLASVACAIQNLWLAARAEGLGLGWCPCSTRPRWPRCWACRKAPSPSPCCASAMSPSSIPNRCWNRKSGPAANRWSNWCSRTLARPLSCRPAPC